MIAPSLPVAAGAVVVVYVVLLAVAHLLQRVRGLRFAWTYHAFAVGVGLLVGAQLLPDSVTWRVDLVKHLTSAVVVLAAFPIVTLLNRALWIRPGAAGKHTEAPRVLIDATGVLVLVLAVLAAMQFVYGIQVPGLIAGSGVIALVLGLGMQDQLHNLFAGISLHFEKPFKTGDWLLIDGNHAKVIEISWRSTRLLTTDDVLIDVANSHILKQTINNFELPTPEHAVRATIGLHYDVPPVQAQAVLKEAAASVPGVLPHRTPVIYVKELADSAIVYEIKVWIGDHSQMSRVLSDVRSHCWYAVKRAGMEIPYPQLTIHRPAKTDNGAAARAAAVAALRTHAIFGFLPAAQLETLVGAGAVVKFATHEHLMTQDESGESMFFLVRGQVDVRITRNGQASSVAQLDAGGCIGEMSLLTGDPRTATVVALSEVEAVEIRKPEFAALVRTNPDALERLSELLTQRQLANAQHAASGPAASAEQVRSGFRQKLRAFFQLG